MGFLLLLDLVSYWLRLRKDLGERVGCALTSVWIVGHVLLSMSLSF